jgi:hypothetical protein
MKTVAMKGTVVQLDGPHLVPRRAGGGVWVGRAIIGVLLVPVILVVGVVACIARLAWRLSFRWVGSSIPRRGFARDLLADALGFGLVHRLLGNRPQMPIRDVRIRDVSGVDHHVRVSGELVAGNFALADQVAVQGTMRYGTLFFRDGYNYRTRSEIRVR